MVGRLARAGGETLERLAGSPRGSLHSRRLMTVPVARAATRTNTRVDHFTVLSARG